VLTLAQETVSAAGSPVAAILFFALAGLVVISAWSIVLSQNIVRMAVYLLLTLAGAAGFYFMLNAEFLAAIQLIVYAGGTLILIIFGVMLTSKDPFLRLKTATWERAIGAVIGLFLAGMLLLSMVHTTLPAAADAGPNAADTFAQPHTVAAIGRGLLTEYVVPFEVAGVLLLIVMIGAAYMARRRGGTQGPRERGT
jgi:NADH:ubiquinone oxidoreductase subunit 6 (subunit J)